MAIHESPTVTNEITDALGLEIVGGLYPPGSAIPGEEEICARFVASRSAAREAVKILAAKGFLQTRPRRGSRVRSPRDWNFLDPTVLSWVRQTTPPRDLIIELFEMRLAFECEAAALAAERGQPAEVAAIRGAFERMQKASQDGVDSVASDVAFHEAVLAATHNRLFQPLSALIHTALEFSVPTTNALFGDAVGDLRAHQTVLSAIEARDVHEARSAMRGMLAAVLERVKAAPVLPEPGKEL